MGSIRRAPRNPRRWEVRYRDPAGRQRTKTFPTKADATAWDHSVEVNKRRGAFVDPRLGRITLAEFAATWIATKADVSPRTLVNIEGRLRNHILPAFGDVPVGRIQASDVRVFVAGLTRSGLAPSTVKAAYLVLAQVLRTAAVDGLIARSPCIDVDLPRDRHRESMAFLDPGEVDALADAIGDRYRAFVYLAAYGGLRAGELAALRVGRVNLLARTIEVSEAASEVRGRLTFGPTKTGRVRTIGLPSFLADMIGQHIGRYPSAEGFVFTAAEGGPIRHRNFYARHFRPAVARAGLPDALRFHDLRHTCAALLIANGRHMEEVKDHLGHSSIRVTSDRYGHLFPRARQALADSLDATFEAAATRREVSCGADVVQLDVAQPAGGTRRRETPR